MFSVDVLRCKYNLFLYSNHKVHKVLKEKLPQPLRGPCALCVIIFLAEAAEVAEKTVQPLRVPCVLGVRSKIFFYICTLIFIYLK